VSFTGKGGTLTHPTLYQSAPQVHRKIFKRASICIRAIAKWLPLPTPAVWLLAVTFCVGSYLLLERVFSIIEFTREKTMNRFAEEY
jgi:hypothetical protein